MARFRIQAFPVRRNGSSFFGSPTIRIAFPEPSFEFFHALFDPLTRTYTRKYLYVRLEKECARVRRHGDRMAVILIGILSPEGPGHPVRDEIRVAASRVIVRALRETDLVGRLGPDRFVLVLTATDESGARTTLARIEERLAAIRSRDAPEGIHVATGLALCGKPADVRDASEVVRRAELDLERSKKALDAASEAVSLLEHGLFVRLAEGRLG